MIQKEYNKMSKFTVGVLTGDTRMLRFWFSIFSLVWVFMLLSDNHHHVQFVASIVASPEIIAFFMIIYSASLMYGIFTEKFNDGLLLLEGVLGTFIWGSLAISDIFEYQYIGMTSFGGIVALYLLIRYPFEYNKRKSDEF